MTSGEHDKEPEFCMGDRVVINEKVVGEVIAYATPLRSNKRVYRLRLASGDDTVATADQLRAW